jgi:hypothetical protein
VRWLWALPKPPGVTGIRGKAPPEVLPAAASETLSTYKILFKVNYKQMPWCYPMPNHYFFRIAIPQPHGPEARVRTIASAATPARGPPARLPPVTSLAPPAGPAPRSRTSSQIDSPQRRALAEFCRTRERVGQRRRASPAVQVAAHHLRPPLVLTRSASAACLLACAAAVESALSLMLLHTSTTAE